MNGFPTRKRIKEHPSQENLEQVKEFKNQEEFKTQEESEKIEEDENVNT